MSVPQRQLIETITQQCERIEERFPKYRKRLLESIAEIVAVERSHMISHTNVVQKIADQCEALGDLLARDAKEK